MGFGALRSIVRPLSRTLLSRTSASSTTPFIATSASPKFEFRLVLGGGGGGGSVRNQSPWLPISNHLHSLTDTRFPKRRPMCEPRRKRSSMKPPGTLFQIEALKKPASNAYQPKDLSFCLCCANANVLLLRNLNKKEK